MIEATEPKTKMLRCFMKVSYIFTLAIVNCAISVLDKVRSFGQDRKNISKIKPLKRNAAGLQLLGTRTILTDQSDPEVKTESKDEPYTRCFEQPFKRFSYALQSTWRSDARKHLTNNPSVDMLSSNEEKETRNELDTQYEDLFSFADTDLFVGQKKTTFKNCEDTSPKKQLLRKYRMRDEFGNIMRRVRVKNPIAKKVILPKSPKRHVAQRLNSLTLNIRCFKVGMLTKNFRRSDALTNQCTFTVDYIEIANQERIEASDLMGCEWCTEQKLPALFLQTTPETCLHLQVQLDMSEDDSEMWCDCRSRNENEKYVVLIFENEITLSEQIILEEIFTEMGKRHNISCFPAKLSFEEASNRRLKAHQCAQKQELEEDELPVMSQVFQTIPFLSRFPFFCSFPFSSFSLPFYFFCFLLTSHFFCFLVHFPFLFIFNLLLLSCPFTSIFSFLLFPFFPFLFPFYFLFFSFSFPFYLISFCFPFLCPFTFFSFSLSFTSPFHFSFPFIFFIPFPFPFSF
uniref:SUMO specific peptidase 6b n=1 Tax=Cyprinus carpio TaxID=7962 RepID=A0A8C1J2X2_CYPCA